MTQSFWTTKKYKNFQLYDKWIRTDIDSLTGEDRKKYVKKWKDAVLSLRQEALSWGVDFPEPDSGFLSGEAGAKVRWIDPNIDGIEKIGVWNKPNAKVDGYFVFNTDWFKKTFTGLEKKNADMILLTYINFDCEPYEGGANASRNNYPKKNPF